MNETFRLQLEIADEKAASRRRAREARRRSEIARAMKLDRVRRQIIRAAGSDLLSIVRVDASGATPTYVVERLDHSAQGGNRMLRITLPLLTIQTRS